MNVGSRTLADLGQHAHSQILKFDWRAFGL